MVGAEIGGMNSNTGYQVAGLLLQREFALQRPKLSAIGNKYLSTGRDISGGFNVTPVTIDIVRGIVDQPLLAAEAGCIIRISPKGPRGLRINYCGPIQS